MQPTIIGLDLAKSVFQVHGVDAAGEVVVSRQLKRSQMIWFFSRLAPCLVAMEACASAHYWARELMALGHEVRLIPPAYVRPYVRRNKTDAADAAAICEAASRPGMRFVPVKSPQAQAVLALHRTRALMIGHRTAGMNALRAHLAEFGIIAPVGAKGFADLLAQLEDPALAVPDALIVALKAMAAHLASLEVQIHSLEAEILAWHKSCETSRRLAAAPGIGPIIASALAAAVPDPHAWRTGRDFAASLGLTPRIRGTGGKDRPGAISKRGDGYLRRLLVNGAQSLLASRHAAANPRLARLLEKPRKLAAVALANRIARMVWAMLAHNTAYRPA